MSADAIQLEIIAMERRRKLYSTMGILLMIAVLASGYGLASSMNSGSFLTGLQKFFDYPGEIAVEAWVNRADFAGLLWQFNELQQVGHSAFALWIGQQLPDHALLTHQAMEHQPVELGHFRAAGGTPGRPDVEHGKEHTSKSLCRKIFAGSILGTPTLARPGQQDVQEVLWPISQCGI